MANWLNLKERIKAGKATTKVATSMTSFFPAKPKKTAESVSADTDCLEKRNGKVETVSVKSVPLPCAGIVNACSGKMRDDVMLVCRCVEISEQAAYKWDKYRDKPCLKSKKCTGKGRYLAPWSATGKVQL